MKLSILRIICHTAYFLGDMISRLPQGWYPVYRWLMSASCEISVKYDLDIWTRCDKDWL